MIETIPKQSGVSFVLKKGQTLFIRDPHGEQVADFFCAKLDNPSEVLSCHRTWDYNDTIQVTVGTKLYSQHSQILAEVLEDSCGTHDLLMPPCSLKMFQIVAGNEEYHPSCQENLAKNLEKFGIPSSTIHNSFNIFMNVEANPKGQLEIKKPLSRAGDRISIRAACDLIVGLTACSHEQTNNGKCKPIEYWITS